MALTESEHGDDYFKSIGFEAGESLRQFDPGQSITKEALKSALFDSTYDDPKTLSIEVDDDVTLKVVVTLVRTVYVPNIVAAKDSPLGCWPLPELCFQGWLLKSGFDPYSEVVRVRGVLMTQEVAGSFDIGYIQRIPAQPDPDAPLVFV